MKRQDGMTLIALLLTIVTIVVLGGITVGLAISNHGILNPERYKDYNKKMEILEESKKAEGEAKPENSSSEENLETSENTEAETTSDSSASE